MKRPHQLSRTQLVCRPLQDVFAFFADASFAHLLFVRRAVDRIFDFRRGAIERLLDPPHAQQASPR